MKLGKTILGYFLAGAFLFYLFALWNFPYERLKNAWVRAFEEALPLKLSIERLAPVLPWSLRLEGIRLSRDNLSFRLPDLVLRPDLGSLLRGQAGGILEEAENPARMGFEFRQRGGKTALTLRMNRAEVQARAGKDASFQVRLSGNGSLEWDGADWQQGNGALWTLMERGKFQGNPDAGVFLPLRLFDSLRGDFELKGGVVRVKRLEAAGRETRFALPRPVEIPLKGGGLPPDLSLFLG